MSYKVTGADEPESVEALVRPDGMTTDVWLRRDINHDTLELYSLGADKSITCDQWSWEEDHLVLPGAVSADAIDFESMWRRAERESKTTGEIIEALQARIDEQDAALMELGDMMGGE